jgi:plastocyanin
VRGEGRQYFILLTRRDAEVIERASQLRCDFIELLGGDVEVAMGLFQPEGGTSWPRGSKREGSTGDIANPQGAHELQSRQPLQLLGMPLTKLRVLRCLADDGILDDRIAEVVDHRSDGEHASIPSNAVWEGRYTSTEDASDRGAVTINIIGQDGLPAFEPAIITGEPGQTLDVTVYQTDDRSTDFQHNFSVNGAGVEAIDKDIPKGAGHSVTVTVTLPTTGRLAFFCAYHVAMEQHAGLFSVD